MRIVGKKRKKWNKVLADTNNLSFLLFWLEKNNVFFPLILTKIRFWRWRQTLGTELFLETDRAWNSLSIGVFCFHFSANLLVRKCEILESTQNLFSLWKTILIMKNLYRQTEFNPIVHHVAGLSYYLYHHLNQVRTS